MQVAIRVWSSRIRRGILGALPFVLTVQPVLAGPTVVPTAEGQIGEPLDATDVAAGQRLIPIGGDMGDILVGGIFIPGGSPPPPPEFQFLTDEIHGYPDPVPIDSRLVTVDAVEKVLPASADWTADAMAAGVYAASSDGTMPNTQSITVAIVPTVPGQTDFVVLDNIPTFPDPNINAVGVAADDQGRITVAYTDLSGGVSQVRGQQIDGVTGLPVGGSFGISDVGHAAPAVALLDPAGNRLIVPTSDFATIRGNLIDTSGGTPVVLPEFPISTTPAAFANFLPVVASATGVGGIVAWENLSGAQGDPVNIFGRRFDADGNPIGTDFMVNTTTANAQGQPAVAMDPTGNMAVVWAGSSSTPGDGLDVFLQVYDAKGQPIDGEIRVNTDTSGEQDRPDVRFMPERDDLGRLQLAVTWRDADLPGGTNPRGTGQSYRCFSIEGPFDPMPIFADGFESGDTTSWSDSMP